MLYMLYAAQRKAVKKSSIFKKERNPALHTSKKRKRGLLEAHRATARNALFPSN